MRHTPLFGFQRYGLGPFGYLNGYLVFLGQPTDASVDQLVISFDVPGQLGNCGGAIFVQVFPNNPCGCADFVHHDKSPLLVNPKEAELG